jgi:hypothetical protein
MCNPSFVAMISYLAAPSRILKIAFFATIVMTVPNFELWGFETDEQVLHLDDADAEIPSEISTIAIAS